MEDDMKFGGAISFAEYSATAPELAAELEERGKDSLRTRAFTSATSAGVAVGGAPLLYGIQIDVGDVSAVALGFGASSIRRRFLPQRPTRFDLHR
jgi:hypothetical protein